MVNTIQEDNTKYWQVTIVGISKQQTLSLRLTYKTIIWKYCWDQHLWKGVGREQETWATLLSPQKASAIPRENTKAGSPQSWPRMGLEGPVIYIPSVGQLVVVISSWEYSSTIPSSWRNKFWRGIWESCNCRLDIVFIFKILIICTSWIFWH